MNVGWARRADDEAVALRHARVFHQHVGGGRLDADRIVAIAHVHIAHVHVIGSDVNAVRVGRVLKVGRVVFSRIVSVRRTHFKMCFLTQIIEIEPPEAHLSDSVSF